MAVLELHFENQQYLVSIDADYHKNNPDLDCSCNAKAEE